MLELTEQICAIDAQLRAACMRLDATGRLSAFGVAGRPSAAGRYSIAPGIAPCLLSTEATPAQLRARVAEGREEKAQLQARRLDAIAPHAPRSCCGRRA